MVSLYAVLVILFSLSLSFPAPSGGPGDQGAPGFPGDFGPGGDIGDKGFEGDQGPEGERGIKGVSGSLYAGWLVVRHSQNVVEPTCPQGWAQHYTGYSYLQTHGGGNGIGQDLGRPGSCLRKFNMAPFVQCSNNNEVRAACYCSCYCMVLAHASHC